MNAIAHALRTVAAYAALLILVACAGPGFRAGDPCMAEGFTVIDGFVGARRGTCVLMSPDHVRLDIRPESDGRINDSPWFAFRVEPGGAQVAKLSLRYHGGHHRYWPKISHDGLVWTRLDDNQVRVSGDGRSAELDVPLSGGHVWVAAQELITPKVYEVWNQKISATTGVPLKLLGESRAGLPIHAFDTGGNSKDILFLVGRQHPPEVSGAFAFFAFAETVFSDSDIARKFRSRFRVIAIPLMNPDGVTGGNWRNNLGNVDLNRDWGKFSQPETALVGNLLDELDATGRKLRMFVDFHSTKENVFYTQLDATEPPGFTAEWLERSAARITDYDFRNGQGPATSPYIAKNYFFTRYGIPSVTFEVGDETNRESTRRAARIFADELMQLMLEQTY